MRYLNFIKLNNLIIPNPKLLNKNKNMLYEILKITKKEVDEAKSTIDAIFSTDDEDRHGDIVVQNWDLKNFKKNPVILNSHNYGDAMEVIGKATNVKIVDGKLEGKIQFAVGENPKAKIIFDLYKGGFLNAFSVGFIPREWSDANEILKSELLEVSAVSVPANAMALAKAKGIEVEKLYEQNYLYDVKNKKDNGDPAAGEDDGGEANGKKDGEVDEANGGAKGAKKNRIKEYEDNWDESGDEIRVKLKDISEFEPGTFEKITFQKELPRVFAIIGNPKGDKESKMIQTLFFPKSDGWTKDDAHKWFTVHFYRTLLPIDHEEQPKGPAKETDGSAEIENEDSINTGKAMIMEKLLDVCVVGGKIYFINKEKRQKILNKLASVISQISEEQKVETRQNADRAERKRAINKAVRKLVEEKSKI